MSLCIEINLNAIKDNLRLIKNGAKDKKICAVVKANAYGHGAKKVCQSIKKDVDYFAVAYANEGKLLRAAGVDNPILVLNPTNYDTKTCIDYDLTIGVGSLNQINYVLKTFEKTKKRCPLHLQINSGMNRLGFSNFDEFCLALNELKGTEVNGVYSHVYSSKSYVDQIEKFKPFEKETKSVFTRAISHISSSNYLFSPYGDMVRAGICLYGYPSEYYTPAMTIKSEVLQVLTLDAFSSCGYDGVYRAGKNNENLAIVKGGYADGIFRNRRSFSGVLFCGEILPIVSVCMDSVAVLTKSAKITRGDTVYFVGESDETKLYFDDIAKQTGTIAYELMVNVSQRARRKYIDIKK